MSVIIVTGAAGGIGQALVARLEQSGHQVIATDIQAAGRVQALDVRSEASWRSLLDSVTVPIDVLVNCAGVASAGRFVDLEASEITRHIEVNFVGAATGMRLVLPSMIERGKGQVVNIGSMAAVAPVPGIALYSASKHALRGLTIAVATELAGTGVQLSMVNPDLVETPMIAQQRHQEAAAVSFSGTHVLSADEVAQAVCDKVIADKPLEVFLPAHRGALARISGTFPRLGQAMAPLLRRRGLRQQQRQRAKR